MNYLERLREIAKPGDLFPDLKPWEKRMDKLMVMIPRWFRKLFGKL